ncbi:hypothetical protein FHX42_003121 [Saccharopolyspora lacisalsi]|uniref:Uncharacterized protein n=1 Tax=Halosaccharopolyspora lacisalsi TaxID=1000566 RepID=A0A839E205_9PSEU|nr:hypothetical protein [Halosaccharopolyspora lacisalsi]MBA8825755.1 hypothetical protein [Halosaccharopolyspora lacisalsi]
MRGYTAHLIFHILAAAIGGACGLTAALWRFDTVPTAATMFFGALLLGAILLALQALYIRVARPRDTSGATPSTRRPRPGPGGTHRPGTGTRPEPSTRPQPDRW